MNKFTCLAVLCAIVAALLQCAAAEVYVVGDGIGWQIPPMGAATYANWASGKTFRVGDILTFNFSANTHNVLRVPKASFDACSSNNAIGSIITNGPANVTLNSTGDHYYICTVGGHCGAGQKLAITVVSSASPPANPPSTSPPSPSSPNHPNAPAPTPIAQGPKGATQPAGTPPPPPPPSSSNAVYASLAFAFASILVGIFV